LTNGFAASHKLVTPPPQWKIFSKITFYTSSILTTLPSIFN
jgi:hypothetical protein